MRHRQIKCSLALALAGLCAFITGACAPPLAPLFGAQYARLNLSVISHRPLLASIQATFTLCCTVSMGGAADVSIIESGIQVTGTSSSIQVLQNNNCTLTITNFFDGTDSFTPNVSPLVITISSTGTVTSSGTMSAPPTYTDIDSDNLYLFMTSGSSSSITLAYNYDPVEVPLTLSGF